MRTLLDNDTDHYEVLQLSPRADAETVSRVHRILAARYHPDNSETGDAAMFRAVSEAYRILGDADSRAAYDANYTVRRQLRLRIFDGLATCKGTEGEKRKRHGILTLLYAKRQEQPGQPSMALREMEQFLGCPKEHLEFPIWYLKEKALISGADNARFQITAAGVDAAEASQNESKPHLLAAAGL